MFSFLIYLTTCGSPATWDDTTPTPFSFTPTQSWANTRKPLQTWPTNSPSWPPTRSPKTTSTTTTSSETTTSNSGNSSPPPEKSVWEKNKYIIIGCVSGVAAIIVIVIIVVVVIKIRKNKEKSSVFLDSLLAPGVDII